MQSTVTSPQSPQTGLSDHAVSDALGLWEPKRTLTLEAFYRALGAEPSKVTAMAGEYDDVDNILNLSDTVNLETDDGYACRTSEAKIFTKDKRISGNALISCKGNFGDVSGNSYTITDDYKVYTFAGGMTATITRDEAIFFTSRRTDGCLGTAGFTTAKKTLSQ